MPDLLVKLYDITNYKDIPGVVFHRPLPHEAPTVLKFIESHFGKAWSSEAAVAFSNKPVSIFLAVNKESGKPEGFCCYECTSRGFLGPVGVTENVRGRGVGRQIVLRCLHSMREMGYGYAVIGNAGSIEFFRKTCGAILIQDSDPGIYKSPLQRD